MTAKLTGKVALILQLQNSTNYQRLGADESTAIKTVEAATRSFGQIDILINNTGVGNYKNLLDTRRRSTTT